MFVCILLIENDTFFIIIIHTVKINAKKINIFFFTFVIFLIVSLIMFYIYFFFLSSMMKYIGKNSLLFN